MIYILRSDSLSKCIQGYFCCIFRFFWRQIMSIWKSIDSVKKWCYERVDSKSYSTGCKRNHMSRYGLWGCVKRVDVYDQCIWYCCHPMKIVYILWCIVSAVVLLLTIWWVIDELLSIKILSSLTVLFWVIAISDYIMHHKNPIDHF